MAKDKEEIIIYIAENQCDLVELRLDNDYSISVFYPKFIKLNDHNSHNLIYIFWYIFSLFSYKIFYVKDKTGAIVHYSHVIPYIFKYRFMNKKRREELSNSILLYP